MKPQSKQTKKNSLLSKQAKHELLEDIDDLEEMSKKWMKHTTHQDDSQNILEESSSQLIETETDDDYLQESQHQQVQQQQMQKMEQVKQNNFNSKMEESQNEEFENQNYDQEEEEQLQDEYEIYNHKKNDKSILDLNQSQVSQKSIASQKSYKSQQSSQSYTSSVYGKQSNQENKTGNLQKKPLNSQQTMYKSGKQPSKNETNKNSINIERTQRRNHMPQIIDEDTEHFKVKLDHLISVFKTDAISEFMSMKKSMLDDQKQQVKYDTEKYLSMYEEKAKELTNTKEILADQIRENEILVKRYEGFAEMCGQAKDRFRMQKAIGNYFTTLKNYKRYKMEKKHKKRIADHIYKKNLLKRTFNIWETQFTEIKQEKQAKVRENNQVQEIDEITARYNKELQTIRARLQETENLLEQANIEKVNLQDNLKKAFMRGVCALNFEAMNILGQNGNTEASQEIQQQQQQSVQSEQQSKLGQQQLMKNTQNLTQTLNDMDVNLNNSKSHNNNSQLFDMSQQFEQRDYDNDEDDQDAFQSTQNFEKQKTVVFYQQPRIESKDHKWRDAPVVGIKQQQQMKPETTATTQLGTSLPDFVSGAGQSKNIQPFEQQQYEDDENQIEQGRVIRITQQKQVKFDPKASKAAKTTSSGFNSGNKREFGKAVNNTMRR